jgi:hypothetical protein
MTQRCIAPAWGLALMLTVGAARPAPTPRRASVQRTAMSAPRPVEKTTVAGLMEKVTFTGFVMGRSVGRIDTIVSAKRTTRVDISHARIQNEGGSAPPTALTPETFVRVEGTMNGATFAANNVEILRPANVGKKRRAGSRRSSR